MAAQFAKVGLVVAGSSRAFALTAVSYGQSVPGSYEAGTTAATATPPESEEVRPDHIWSVDYVQFLWSDTGAVLLAPAQWDGQNWAYAGIAAAGIGAAAALDQTIKSHVQAHRSAGADRFFSQYQNLGATWSFGLIGTFEVWGEAVGDTTAKNTAMDALTASIIGPGLIGTSAKYAVGRVRPNSATSTFDFKPFSANQSFPSGHACQAFAVATAISENYPAWWVRLLCYGGAGLVGYARIEQNAHYTSDVVAGAVLGWSVARQVVHRHDDLPNPKRLSWTPYVTGNGGGLIFSKAF